MFLNVELYELMKKRFPEFSNRQDELEQMEKELLESKLDLLKKAEKSLAERIEKEHNIKIYELEFYTFEPSWDMVVDDPCCTVCYVDFGKESIIYFLEPQYCDFQEEIMKYFKKNKAKKLKVNHESDLEEKENKNFDAIFKIRKTLEENIVGSRVVYLL